MVFTTRSSLSRLAAGMLVPLALAGTCLAVPALAASASTSATATEASAEAAATETAVAEGTVLAAGGVQLTVPGEWSSMDLGDSMKVATSEDGNMYACIVVLDAQTAADSGYVADDTTKYQEFFDTDAKAYADVVGGSVVSSSGGTFDDGSVAYLYVIDGTANTESPTVTAMAYIPQADGSLTEITVAADPTAEGVTDTLEGILKSIDQADTSAQAASTDAAVSQVELGQTVEAGGLVLSVPSDMVVEDEDADTGEVDLMSEDGLMFVSVIPDIFEGETLTDTDDLKDVVDSIATALGGEVLDSTVVNANGVTTRLYALILEAEDVKLLGSLGFTELADGTTTCVMGVCASDYEANGNVLDAIYGSIALAK